MGVTFEIPFVHGLQRHGYSGPGRHAYDTARNREDKAAIATLYRSACGRSVRMRPTCAARRVPVAVDMTVERPLPASRPMRVRLEDDVTKPDIDNVAKLVLDALNGVAWEDDAQVVLLSARRLPRRRGGAERVTVTIRRPDWGDR